MHYIKFSLFHALGLIGVVALLAGSSWLIWAYLGTVSFIVFGDLLLGSDTSTPKYSKPRVMDALLFMSLPIQCLLFLASMWLLARGDLGSFGLWVHEFSGIDILHSKQQVSPWALGAGVFYIGLLYSTVGTVPAHELVHRTYDRTSVNVGRWLLAFSFDSSFAIEHVYGHHKHVATAADPASAPRNRNVYSHILHSTWFGNISAWNIEKQRLKRKKLPLLSLHNQCLQGYAMSALLVAAAYGLAGWRGMVFFTCCAVVAKTMLEVVNYIEHYGLSRKPGSRVQPYHSWNANNKISSWALFNLPRHSHHHAQANVHYEKLSPYPDAPMMPSGYLGSMILALIPPLWHALMEPKLDAWHRQYDEETEVMVGK